MSDESAPVAEVQAYALPADAPAEMTVSEAARMLSKARQRSQEPPAESAKEATAEEPELAQEADAAPEEDPGESETQEAEPEDNLPPIEPPRSWTKDEKDTFKSWPREAQESIARVTSTREADFRRSQNDAADKLKALTAKEQQAEEVRQQYESKLSSTVKVMESTLQAEFGDIQTMQDVRKLQNDDPFRFQAWQVRQMELTGAKAEQLAAEQRQTQEKQNKRANYEAEQNKLLIELVPEMAEPKKASELRERAVSMLTDDLGLKNEQLSRWMADDIGHEILSNAGIQKLIADGLKYRDILKAPKAVAAKSLPPVQRPGVAKSGTQSVTLKIQNIQSQLSTATGNQAIRLAADLTRLKRAR